jgi:hypothetical protein
VIARDLRPGWKIYAVLAALAILPYLRALGLPMISDDHLQVMLGRQYGPASGWSALTHDVLYRSRATSLLLTHWTEILTGLSPLAFLILLTVELSLLYAATSNTASIGRAARVAVYLIPLVLNFGLRAYQALATRDLLEWDETYYVSLAVTAAGGRG